ncbi:YIP1 family protein [Candidatus Micrarchaeota archaeon]|nr:YIP1 family protein [Candidatus Micrarchaeota archaeon]MBU1165565.1 YIP1 family protein [Candidatus Micrarchaeota archaeon]MBU1887375.1 YIP1 family protein [Candidatus Micrarchaeota archaeon]
MNYIDLVKVFKPKEIESYFTEMVKEAKWSSVLVNYCIALAIGLVGTVISLVIQAIQVSLSGNFNIVSSVMVLVSDIAMSFVGFFIFGFMLHLIAKAFGGKGEARGLLFLMSLVNLVCSPVLLIIRLLSLITCVGCLLLPVSLIFGIYILYLYYKAVKISHQLEKDKAIMAVIAWVVIMIIIMVIIVVVLFGLSIITSFLTTGGGLGNQIPALTDSGLF